MHTITLKQEANRSEVLQEHEGVRRPQGADPPGGAESHCVYEDMTAPVSMDLKDSGGLGLHMYFKSHVPGKASVFFNLLASQGGLVVSCEPSLPFMFLFFCSVRVTFADITFIQATRSTVLFCVFSLL